MTLRQHEVKELYINYIVKEVRLMGWKQLDTKCPVCGEPLYTDTSTGEVCCLNCDYEK